MKESLHESWERYKDLMRKCPHHGLPTWLQLQTFYNGLLNSTKVIKNAMACGALMGKTHD